MIISKTPLRISFVGGGTDLPSFYRKSSGAVISSTIDKYVYVIIKERFDDLIYINWKIKEIEKCVSDLKHELVREAMKKVGIDKVFVFLFHDDLLLYYFGFRRLLWQCYF